MEMDEAVKALAALAQGTRLAVFRLLVEAGPGGLTVGGINARLDIAPATLSFHLKELAHAGLIESRQEGRYIHCSASFERMNALLAFLTDNCCGGNPALCSPPARLRTATPARKRAVRGGRPSQQARKVSG